MELAEQSGWLCLLEAHHADCTTWQTNAKTQYRVPVMQAASKNLTQASTTFLQALLWLKPIRSQAPSSDVPRSQTCELVTTNHHSKHNMSNGISSQHKPCGHEMNSVLRACRISTLMMETR